LDALEDSRGDSATYTFSERSILQLLVFQSAYGEDESTRRALQRVLVGDRFGWMGQHRLTDEHALSIFNLPSNADVAIAEFQRRGRTEFAIQGQRYVHWQNWRHANRNLRLGNLRSTTVSATKSLAVRRFTPDYGTPTTDGGASCQGGGS
jgi:hypothetical protein